MLLSTPEQTHVLIDGGPDWSVLVELGDALPPFVRTLDLVVLTHPHADHVVGLIEVLKRFEVGAVLLSAPAYETEEYTLFIELLSQSGIPVYFAQAEQDFKLGNLALDVLYPFEPLTGARMENVNNASVVLRAQWGEDSVLLMGDAETEVEAELLAHYEGTDLLKADLIKAGHHGSGTSNGETFLQAVDARGILISCGVGNSYGHPHPHTLAEADLLNLQVLRTDLDGRVSIEFDEPFRWKLTELFYSWIRSIFAPSVRSFSSSFS